MPAIFRNYFFYIALAIGLLFIAPYIYLKINKRSIFVEYVMRFHKIETSAITPDMPKYKPPYPGTFTTADFVHFKLEYVNAVVHCLPKFRKRLAQFVFTRYSTNPDFIKKFMSRPGHQAEVEAYLKEFPVWRRKTEIALSDAKKKKIPIPF